MTEFDVIIVGGGHGGAQAAIMLRQQGFSGSIALIGEENEFPYERPPLSKDYFAGEKSFERILIRPPAFWDDRNITMVLGQRIVSVDPIAKMVSGKNGQSWHYGALIWATGGHARRLPLPGAMLSGVFGVRTRADADAMKAAAETATNIVVIGGGYIGLESAAVLIKMGKHVTLLEALPRVLARVAGEALSRFYEAEHRARGVDIRLGVAIEAIEGEDAATGVRLASGEVVNANLVIVGIGIVPEIEPLVTAGAAAENGVLVDDHCRTSLPDVFAVGDCAAHTNHFADGATVRLESVQNANDQATTVAKTICGVPQPYNAVPWFWSNQFDLRLQTVGLSTGHDTAITRGDPAVRSFSVVYLRAGRVIALDCVNATKDYVQGRLLVQNGAIIPAAKLADASIPLKTMLAASS